MKNTLRLLFVFCLFFVSSQAADKPKVCLNMIVKNESSIITRCLDSVKPMIDYWVIVDTGSTDGTQDIIKNHMKKIGIPGELYERPWKNFEHNRNEALALAKDKAEYILIIDADDQLEYDPNFKMPTLDRDFYHMWIHLGATSYSRTQLIKASLPWKWIGVLHEALNCDKAMTSDVLQNVKYVCTRDGARSHDPQKYQKDAKILEAAVKEDPNNARYVFYLAQSYRDAGDPASSLKWYLRRIELGGWDEEVFWSMYQVALNQMALQMPKDVVIESFNRAHRYRPHRIEPIYHLAEIYNQSDNHAMAYSTIKGYYTIKQPARRDVLFNQDWAEKHGVPFQLSIAAYWMAEYPECIELCDKLLSMDDLPEAWREQTIRNRQHPINRLKEREAILKDRKIVEKEAKEAEAKKAIAK